LTCSGDVLSAFGLEPNHACSVELGEHAAAVLAALAEEPSGADQLGRVTGLDAATLATALTELELVGAAAESEGLWRGVKPQG
jgi:predicted Rossmann fold nucleotide-binding protein DprA/Smf involved in DNA uptake